MYLSVLHISRELDVRAVPESSQKLLCKMDITRQIVSRISSRNLVCFTAHNNQLHTVLSVSRDKVVRSLHLLHFTRSLINLRPRFTHRISDRLQGSLHPVSPLIPSFWSASKLFCTCAMWSVTPWLGIRNTALTYP